MTQDISKTLQQQVLSAVKTRRPLQIAGGNSKFFYGRAPTGQVLSTEPHQGILTYQPSELVVTARAGTRLIDIERVLAEQGQMLAFEPPQFSETATLGGTVACGLSGPRRPFAGSVRDFVLGCKIINGRGEILSFGGEVMKNVAGYDFSRLMVGAMGTLGLLLEVSLKVLPAPVSEKTLVFELPRRDAIQLMLEISGRALPVSGLCYDGVNVSVRLSGPESAVSAASNQLGGDEFSEGFRFWLDLKEHRLGFFLNRPRIWRLSLPASVSDTQLKGDWFYDWGGALRWLVTDALEADVYESAARMEGHAIQFISDNRNGDLFQPMSGKLEQLHKNLKTAFDPYGLFNPYRLNRAW